MAQSRRGSTYSKNAVIEIFGLLWEETDYQHGLTIPQIRQRLIERHEETGDPDYQAPSERTIREQLNWLSDPANTILNRPIRKVSRIECEREGITDFTPGWYMSAYLNTAEMRLLADSLMISRINEDMIEDLGEKIMRISGGRNALPRRFDNFDAITHYNPDFLHTVGGLDRAIEQGWCVDFEYCEYDEDGNLKPRQYDDGTVKHYVLDPYRTMFKHGKYYILGHVRGSNELTVFTVDRIRNLQVLENVKVEIPLERWQEDGTLRPASDLTDEARAQMETLKRKHKQGIPANRGDALDPIKYMRERPYMIAKEAVSITMVLRERMITSLYEWFDEPHIIDIRNGNYLVQVMSPEDPMLWWVMQYSNSNAVYVIEPQSLRGRLRELGRSLAEDYDSE